MKPDTYQPLRIISYILLAVTALVVVYSNSQKHDYNDILGRVETFSQEELIGLAQVMNRMSTEVHIMKRDPDVYISKREATLEPEPIQQLVKRSKSLLDSPAIRFAIAFGAFLVINMMAILVHHIYMKLSKSEKSYRSIEVTLSPF